MIRDPYHYYLDQPFRASGHSGTSFEQKVYPFNALSIAMHSRWAMTLRLRSASGKDRRFPSLLAHFLCFNFKWGIWVHYTLVVLVDLQIFLHVSVFGFIECSILDAECVASFFFCTGFRYLSSWIDIAEAQHAVQL
jgi:hypothetical protein